MGGAANHPFDASGLFDGPGDEMGERRLLFTSNLERTQQRKPLTPGAAKGVAYRSSSALSWRAKSSSASLVVRSVSTPRSSCR
jgi:hypothetical protein